jgi:ribonuclease inhibitor
MQTIVLPSRQLASQHALHAWLDEVFSFPYNGRNLNALWNLVGATIPLPVTLIWQDFAQSRVY